MCVAFRGYAQHSGFPLGKVVLWAHLLLPQTPLQTATNSALQLQLAVQLNSKQRVYEYEMPSFLAKHSKVADAPCSKQIDIQLCVSLLGTCSGEPSQEVQLRDNVL